MSFDSSLTNLDPIKVATMVNENAAMTSTYSKLTTFKGVLHTCSRIAFSTAETVLMGTHSRAQIACAKLLEFCAKSFFEQTGADTYTKYGKMTSTGFASMGGSVNGDLVRDLSDAADQMGMPSSFGNGVAIRSGSTSSGILSSTSGSSLLPFKVITLHPIFFYRPGHVISLQGGQEQRNNALLTHKLSYARFYGANCLAHIKMNTSLIQCAIQCATVFAAKSIAESLANKGNISPESWTHTIITGLFTKIISDTASALYSRYSTYKADAMTVKATGDIEGAIEALKVVESCEPEIRRIEKILAPIKLLLFADEKQLKLMPSIQDRIKHLDPKELYSKKPLPTIEQKPLTAKETVEALLDKHTALSQIPLIKSLSENEQQLQQVKKMLGENWKSLLWKIPSIYLLRSNPEAALIITGLSMAMNLYPHLIEDLMNNLPKDIQEILHLEPSEPIPYSSQQLKVNKIAAEMGITKPIQVRGHHEGPLDYEATGSKSGPGKAIIKLPGKNTPSEFEEFLLRHEVSHVKHSDSLKLLAIKGISAFGLNVLLNYVGIVPTTYLDTLVQGGLVYLGSNALHVLNAKGAESAADRNAVLSCSPEERERLIDLGVALFEHVQKQQIQLRKLNPGLKLFITATGENRLDIAHPTLKKRKADLLSLKA